MLLHKCIIILCSLTILYADECPKKCTCKRSAQRDGPDWVKLRCGDTEKISNLEELDLLNIANEVVQLNLSNNHLAVFTLKVQFIALQKLDISRNQITNLQENQFIEVPNLRRLDISSNNIKQIDLHAFSHLKHLERLKLNQNQINTIVKGTFKPLEGLKQIDISNNPLTCDCELLWLLDWAEKSSVKLISNPKCVSPQTFRGIPIRKLKVGVDIHCKSPAGNREMPIVELSPNHSQVVFEGDSLKLHCRAPSVTDNFDSHLRDRIEWSWLDSNPKQYFEDIVIENKFLDDSGLIDSSLSISKLNRNHTGIWNCQLLSNQRNHSKGITVVVISDETRYCPIAQTTNNKGTYLWPRTVVNFTVLLPCESIQLNNEISHQKASYLCSPSGEWKNLNTSKCPYVSETTKILEQFSKVNLSLAKGSILESAKHFRNYTMDLKILKDVMDLVYVIRTIKNYLDFISFDKDLGALLMDVSNNLLNCPESYLRMASLEDNSCNKLVKAIEAIASFTPSPLLHKSNIALEIFPVKQEAFVGMTCTWYINAMDKTDRMFYCVTSNHSGLSGTQKRLIEASIQIPASLFYQLQEQDILLAKTPHELLISMFSNGKLFPVSNEKDNIVSAVVGVKLDNFTVKNLTDPIYIMLRSPYSYPYENTHPVPVWWDPLLNNGSGSWSTEGCQYSDALQDNLVFYCKQLGYYGLMQDTANIKYLMPGAKFKFSHPAIYIGSFILFISLLVAILTYLLCYTAIQMPKKTKHSLINTWVAIALLCFMYVFGIYQTEDVQVCQAVGLMLHYFTISSLIWMCVGLNSMYKRLRHSDRIELQDDELPSEEPIQKPIIGLYFVGWGIALIVCGISGAVNMKEYSAHTHCFLNSEPALSALYVPITILLIILCIFFLLIRCAVYHTDAGGHLSEGTQATENVDLDLLEPSFPNVELRSVRSISTKTGSSEIEDPEHSPMVQLKAYVIFLVMYIATWLSCAFATVQPTKLIAYEEVFCIAYAISCTVLGSFILFFYCIARNDVRTRWVQISRCVRQKHVCFRSRNISDTSHNLPQIQIQSLPQIATDTVAEIHVTSRSSSRSSHTKSNSHNSNVLKTAVDLNAPAFHEPPGVKINNVNLVVLHRQQYRNMTIVPNLIENPTNTAEMFYNPHQSTVARKFFKKQKRHMMKRNNLSPRRPDLSDTTSVASFPKPIKDNSSIDQSIFGTNSKVNNTNIHVERIHKIKHRNPNMLFESCEDIHQGTSFDKTYKDRIKKRDLTKQRNKKKQNLPSAKTSLHENNMRSVSQQCTLEYSSEPISDSILDQKSPEKCMTIQETFLAEELPSIRRENSPIESMNTVMQEPQYFNEMSNLPVTENYYKHKNKSANVETLNTVYEPSDVSLSVLESTSEYNEAVPRIYVNPSHELMFTKRVHSRASSVSASEIDELYQQIRRGPKSKLKQSQRYKIDRTIRQPSPCFSDSEITSCFGDVRCRYRMHFFDDGSDKIESTV